MEERIIKFIAALRAGGVRVSLAESEDAFRAVEELGIKNREGFRLSLRATLVKDRSHIPVFEELFPLFFEGSGAPPMMNLKDDLTPQEARQLAEALRLFSAWLRELMDQILKGEPLSEMQLEQAGEMTGLTQATDLRYRDWLSRRMEQALKFPEVREALRELLALLGEMGFDDERLKQLEQFLQANQVAMREQIRQYIGQKIAEKMSEQPPDNSINGLLNRPFNALSEQDMKRLQKEVNRLASALRTRLALRRKRAKSGRLDAKATIRENLKHSNVPIQLKYRDRDLKPKLVVICDISTSMRPVSELMLSLIYALQDQIKKTHAFAFIDHLEYISPDYARTLAKEAIGNVLQRMPPGHYNTDLGFSLEGFARDYLDTVDNRTIFIMVGDGRNNYNDPRLDLFKRIARRSNRMIWINPEAPKLWGTGDSDMLRYAPFCDRIFQVRNLNELTLAIDQLLGS